MIFFPLMFYELISLKNVFVENPDLLSGIDIVPINH